MRYLIVIGNKFYHVDVYPLEEYVDIIRLTKEDFTKIDARNIDVVIFGDDEISDEELILMFIQEEDLYGYRIRAIHTSNNLTTKLCS